MYAAKFSSSHNLIFNKLKITNNKFPYIKLAKENYLFFIRMSWNKIF